MNRVFKASAAVGVGLAILIGFRLASSHSSSTADTSPPHLAGPSLTSISYSDAREPGKELAADSKQGSVEMPPPATANQLSAKVQEYIDENFRDPREKSLVGEIAAAQLDQITRGSRSRQAAIEAFQRSSEASVCLTLSRGATYAGGLENYTHDEKIIDAVYATVNKLTSLIVHDKASMQAYLAFRENLSGQTSSLSRHPDCAK